VDYVQTLSVSDQWIIRLTFDSWNIIGPGHRKPICKIPSPLSSDMNEGEGILAYGASDGSVGLITVSQRLKQSDLRSFTPKYDIEVTIERDPRLVYQADGNAVSFFKWVPVHGRSVSRRNHLIFYITDTFS
jgi:hypothetical protein